MQPRSHGLKIRCQCCGARIRLLCRFCQVGHLARASVQVSAQFRHVSLQRCTCLLAGLQVPILVLNGCGSLYLLLWSCSNFHCCSAHSTFFSITESLQTSQGLRENASNCLPKGNNLDHSQSHPMLTGVIDDLVQKGLYWTD